MMAAAPLARNVTRLAHLDLPGAGQVCVEGNYAYVGHLPTRDRLGTSILDVSDPRKPQLISQIHLEDGDSHSHKARVIGDVMIVNSERNMTPIGRKADELPKLRVQLRQKLGRDPDHSELAEALGVSESEIPAVEAAERTPYEMGGFRVYDIADRAKPRLLAFQKTHGRGVHRFDMDENYAYISTEMPGYLGNILVIYDIRNPAQPQEVSRWWMTGQHVAGGETPAWSGRKNRLHHALRHGDQLWAGCWHGGVRIVDISDIRAPRTVGEFNYHPPFVEPTHSFMAVPFPVAGRQLALAADEEDLVHTAEEMERRRGRPHGCLWVFDVTDFSRLQPLSIYQLSELESPWSRSAPGRFGAHQFREQMDDTLVYVTWFAGGLRIIDIADPWSPREVGHFIPEPPAGRAGPETNDVDLDHRGLIYLVDRGPGFDVLEFERG